MRPQHHIAETLARRDRQRDVAAAVGVQPQPGAARSRANGRFRVIGRAMPNCHHHPPVGDRVDRRALHQLGEQRQQPERQQRQRRQAQRAQGAGDQRRRRATPPHRHTRPAARRNRSRTRGGGSNARRRFSRPASPATASSRRRAGTSAGRAAARRSCSLTAAAPGGGRGIQVAAAVIGADPVLLEHRHLIGVARAPARRRTGCQDRFHDHPPAPPSTRTSGIGTSTRRPSRRGLDLQIADQESPTDRPRHRPRCRLPCGRRRPPSMPRGSGSLLGHRELGGDAHRPDAWGRHRDRRCPATSGRCA